MTSVLSSFFSRDPKSVFPYELPANSFYNFDGIFIGKSFKKAEPSELATCFWATVSDCGPGLVLKAQARKLKTLRHPNVLAYLDSIEMNGTFYLITEACVPLKIYITENKLTDKQKDFVVSWGLFQLMNCLKFLHQEAELSHENIRHSVYVTESGDWKLGGFEKSTSFSSPRTDLNSFALLTWEIFNGFNESVTKPEAPKKIPEQLHGHYKKMATNRAAKLDIGELLRELRQAGGFFKNRYVDTLLFLDEFQLKDAHEKQSFFTELKNELDFFPDNIAKYKILPKIIHSYEYGDAGSHVLMPLFRLGRLLDEDEYQRRIVPCLCKLFSSPDRVTRVKLLERIDELTPHLTPQIINERIYGNIASGFMDTNPAVRDQSFKALHGFIEKLEKASENPELIAELEAQVKAGGKSGLLSSDKVPQWASWALKSLSGKFYKYSPSVQNLSGPTCKKETSVCEPTSITSTYELKSYDKSATKLANDGWSELEDSLSVENEEWEDANDALTTGTTSTNEGWDNEQEGVATAKSKISISASSNPLRKSSGIGGLKLQRAVIKPTVEDDLDYLLGIKPKSNTVDRLGGSEVANRNTFTVKNSSNTLTYGWDDNSTTGDWDNFDVSSGSLLMS
ncbi:SCY1 protein kinase [Loa loa]|uniref:SCY1 protein kinase n=1 Tax=Loa loa TaxID=7209 RepID=A0A1S0UKZ8_LOALO|nr:SCY1 protein kinase [Loa loa]EJD76151.1 SCY1 protein kinase [Loa loa]